jgi:hypothetical protein
MGPHLNIFQIVVGPVLAALFVFSVRKAVRGSHRRAAALGALVWLAAVVTVLWPESTIRVARWMGIGRGADLVLYFFVIAFLLAIFYFYYRMMQLEAALTTIVRQLALRDAAPLVRHEAEKESPVHSLR